MIFLNKIIFSFSFDPTVRHTVWGLTLGNSVQWLCMYGVSQSVAQRYISSSSLKVAKRFIFLLMIGLRIVDLD